MGRAAWASGRPPPLPPSRSQRGAQSTLDEGVSGAGTRPGLSLNVGTLCPPGRDPLSPCNLEQVHGNLVLVCF